MILLDVRSMATSLGLAGGRRVLGAMASLVSRGTQRRLAGSTHDRLNRQ